MARFRGDETPLFPRQESGTPTAPSRPARLPEARAGAERLGRYVLKERLGAGGMGVVWAAHDPELDRTVALKVLRADVWRAELQEDGKARLLREAQAMARLAHPNVVTVHDVGSIDGQVFVATEFVDGWNLRQWLAEKPRGWREVLRVYLEAGRGLSAAHDAGLVHRDFKPDNVLVGKDGRVRVADFGLARPTDRPEPAPPDQSPTSGSRLAMQVTELGQVLGTPAYMSPEQHAGRPLDARSDQFSFAASLYEGLYGELPWASRSSTAAMHVSIALALHREPPAGAKVPRRLRRVLLRALSPEPDQRYPSMRALMAELGKASRAPAWAWVGLAAAVLVLAPVGARVYQWQRARSCSEPPDAASAWNEAQRAGVRRALAATGAPNANTLFDQLDRTLNEYLGRWRAERAEACADAYLHGKTSADVLALRLACLDERLRGFRASVETLAASDRLLAQNALDALATLSPVSFCSDVRALVARGPLPEGDAGEAVQAVRTRLSRARVLCSAGHPADGLAEARAAIEVAARLAYEPLEAEARVVEGLCRTRAGEYELAERAFVNAIAAAEASRFDEMRARAALHLAELLNERADYARGRSFLRLGRSALQQLDRQRSLELWARRLDGRFALDEDRTQEGLQSLTAALRLAEEEHGAESLEAAAIHYELGSAMRFSDRFAEAEAHHRRSLDINRKLRGDVYPGVGMAMAQLAADLRWQGRFDEALEVAARAVAVQETLDGADHVRTAKVRLFKASILWSMNRLAEAERESTQVVRIISRDMGVENDWYANGVWLVGYIRHAQRRFREARASFEAARAAWVAQHGRETPSSALAHLALGTAYLSERRHAEALPHLEKALELTQGRTFPAMDRALLHLQLSRALVGTRRDAARARELLKSGRAALAPGGRSHHTRLHPTLLDEVDAWLASR